MTVYSTPRWRRTRRQFLGDNPTCECGAPATIADHVVPRRQLLEQGVTNPDDPAFLQPLCKPCHDRKTSTLDGGGGRTPLPINER